MSLLELVHLVIIVCRIHGGDCYKMDVSKYVSEPACVEKSPDFLAGYRERNPDFTVVSSWCSSGEDV